MLQLELERLQTSLLTAPDALPQAMPLLSPQTSPLEASLPGGASPAPLLSAVSAPNLLGRAGAAALSVLAGEGLSDAPAAEVSTLNLNLTRTLALTLAPRGRTRRRLTLT